MGGIHWETEQTEAMFDEAIEKLANTEPVLSEAADLILAENLKQWGHGWKPLAEETAAKKGDNELGVESGKMKKALTEKGAPGQTFELGKERVRIGVSHSKDVYPEKGEGNVPIYAFEAGARYSKVGGKKSGFMRQPKRRLMRMTPTVKKKIEIELAKKLLGSIED